jgi:hypothetical protein
LTRIPLGPSSAASRRVRASTAAQVTPYPINPAPAMRDPGVERVRMTPRPAEIMCRAAAFAVMKLVRVSPAMGWA